jgi:hypothetical protein
MADQATELKCKLLWVLCRKHSWASPLQTSTLVSLALDRSQQGRGRILLEELRREPYVTFRRGEGYRIKNDPDSQAQAAYRLYSTCGFLSIQIETTLSRFDQAGGFEAYDSAVLDTLEPWGA